MPHVRGTGRLILLVGGAASGKSRAALELAGPGLPRAFVATGQPLDEEMAERIRRHQAERSCEWETIEIPVEVPPWLEREGPRYQVIVFDCLTLWLSNLCASGAPEDEVLRRATTLVTSMREIKRRVIVVTNELGMGLVPADAETRRFRSLAGAINQLIAREADEVYAVLSGLSVRLK